jgi:hypothetical protein
LALVANNCCCPTRRWLGAAQDSLYSSARTVAIYRFASALAIVRHTGQPFDESFSMLGHGHVVVVVVVDFAPSGPVLWASAGASECRIPH